MTRLRCTLGMGYWMWRAGATRTPSKPLFLFLSCLLSMEHAWPAGQPRGAQSTFISIWSHTVCIQETLLHSNITASFKKYTYYGIPAVETNGSLHDGVGMLVKNTTPHQQLHINTGLHAIALRATCQKTITICSIYLSPSTACNITELEDLIGQLPPPVLLLGISMPTVSNGAPTNAALEGRWWRTSSSNLTSLSP